MYCTKCGKELVSSEKFCSSCGKSQNETKQNFISDDEDKKNLFAFYIAMATLPILFIIRMLAQTSKHFPAGVNGSWRSYDVSYVPGNIKAIMIVLLIVSTFLNISLRKNSNSSNNSKSVATKIMLVANVLLGLVITFGEF